MKNVQVDSNGQLHCWKCGAMAFTEKRTLRAKTVGVVAFGAGALLAKKKLRCQACGEYNDVGSADTFKGGEATTTTTSSTVAPRTDSVGSNDGATYAPRPVDPIKVKGTMCSVTFDGETITVKNLMKSVLRVEDLRQIVLEDFGLWFGVVGAYPPDRTMKAFTENPSAVVFTPKKKPEFAALVAAIETHRA